jgi:hypothetical protein
MSGSRAIAAAINRRTNAPNAAVSNARPGRGGQQQQGSQQQGSQQGRRLPPQPEKQVYPKLSVSDAIALTTIRLGRVESFINALPPLEQIGRQSSTGENHIAYDDNIKVVDEAVFKSIVTRLDKLESKMEEWYSIEFEKILQAKIEQIVEERFAANVTTTETPQTVDVDTEDIKKTTTTKNNKKKVVLDAIE